MKVYCHRTNCDGAKQTPELENSKLGLERVLKIGKGEIGAELDFRLTKDKKLVNSHSGKIGSTLISDITYSDCKFLIYNTPSSIVGKLRTIEELVGTFSQMPLMLEIKSLGLLSRVGALNDYYKIVRDLLLKHSSSTNATNINVISYDCDLISSLALTFEGSPYEFGTFFNPLKSRSYYETTFKQKKPDFYCVPKIVMDNLGGIDKYRSIFGEETKIMGGCLPDTLESMEKYQNLGVDMFLTNNIENAKQILLKSKSNCRNK